MNVSPLITAPAIVKTYRGHDRDGNPLLECVHHCLVSVVDGDQNQLLAIGDTRAQLFLRSCAKPFQVLPLLELGFFDQAPVTPPHFRKADLPLLMSSHSGAHIHTDRVRELLSDMGLNENALHCGIHTPQDEAALTAIMCKKESPSPLHTNCSGKHTAMIIASIFQGYDISRYEEIGHPLQQYIRGLFAHLAEVAIEDVVYGIDGCSLPAFALPLHKIAFMYARLAYFKDKLPPNQPAWLKDAFAKIWDYTNLYPEFLAGDGRFDTELMREAGGKLFSKTGADGMQALAVAPCERYPKGLGIAIKIADGDPRQTIRSLIAKEVLLACGVWPDSEKLENFMPAFTNLRGIVTGKTVVDPFKRLF